MFARQSIIAAALLMFPMAYGSECTVPKAGERPSYCPALEFTSLSCPAEIILGDAGQFETTINNGESNWGLGIGITLGWIWGDGTTGSGLNAEHTFTEPGTYTVTVFASRFYKSFGHAIDLDGEENEAQESCLVTVIP